MLQAMYNGVSAINSTSTAMDVIGNNIANVNTTAYKGSSVTFADQLSETIRGASAPTGSLGGTNGEQVGLGVKVGSVSVNGSQGSLLGTNVPTDLAIQGNGFFQIASSTGAPNYTRDGHFALDSSGNLVSATNGQYVLGWTADGAGNINSSQAVTGASHINIPIGTLTTAQATSGVVGTGTLDAGTPAGAGTTMQMTAYDSLGTAHKINVTVTRQNPVAPATVSNTWNWTATSPETGLVSATGASLNQGTVTFDSTGHVSTSVPPTGSLQISPSNGATSPQAIAISFNNLEQAAPATGSEDATAAPLAATADGSSTPGSASTTVTGVGNLDPTAIAGSTAVMNTISYDAAGTAHNVSVTYTKSSTTANTWTWAATGDPSLTTAAGTTNQGSVTFNASGVETASTGNLSFTSAGVTRTVALNLGAMSQKTTVLDTSVTGATTDGAPVGTLQSFAINGNGVIQGTFSNGLTRALGQVAVATFANPSGLVSTGSNSLSATANSGSPITTTANNNGAGSIQAGYLEQSNVDLGTEFTNMIVQQRSFQANTKIVTTVDQMLNDLISMKQ